MLPVQEYLIENGLEKLKDEYGVIAKEYDNFVVLNYSQTDSPKNDPITDPCRGLILSVDFTQVLCRSFDRFYNMGEAGQTVDNIENYTILEKYDGSLINIWYNPYKEKFQASTRGTGYAESETVYGRKFYQIIEEDILGMSITEFFDNMLPQYTYIFELIGPENRIVKSYSEAKLVFIGMRNMYLGHFSSYSFMNMIYYKFNQCEKLILVEKYSFPSMNSVMESIQTLNAMDEGYVLWNEETGHRVKIKNPNYVAIHHLRDNGALVPRRIVSLVQANEHEEYLNYFECDRQFFQPYIDAYNAFLEDIENVWQDVNHIEDQKQFALWVKDLPIASILFSMKKGFTKEEALGKIQDKRLTEILEKYKE